ncbi:MAG: FkbM family methyltransferase, partial [Solirubrobacterales bacterium]
ARSTHYIGRTVYFYTDNPTSKTSAFSTKHVNDMFRLFQDWREQAEQFSLPEYARAGMDQGVDRLVAVLIRRCLATDAESPRDHLGPLRHIHKLYVALPRYDEQKRDSRLAKFLERLPETRDSSPGIKKEVLADLCTVFPPDSPSSREFPLGIQPTDLARRLAGAIVIVCQVDFHLRAAATWAHALQARGHRTVVLDNTKFVADGRRGLRSDETELFAGIERIVVESSPYELDALATARVVLTFNDFNDDLRDAVEYRQRLDLPTVAVVESINDFLRVDFEPYRYLPYRRCTHVFLAGDYDRDYFQDRQTAVVGMPVVEKLTGVQPVFPDAPLVAINVNFTYGVLESHREEFVRLAVEACKVLGIDYSVTQHPMDNGDLADYNVTELSQYELIDDCSVFVSRFATGIIEALASGKPAVYFNPHGEKVPKFSDPMGAFAVANSVQELKVALAQTLGDIEEGVDFRERALPFLRHHAAYVPGKTTSTRFVDAVEALLESSAESAAAVASLVEQIDAASAGTEAMLGPFTREDDARVHETDVFAHLFAGAGPGHVLLDIGAHFGSSLAPFAEAGWTVVGCEPDPSNRARLEERFGEDENVSIDPRAVSYEVARGVPLFTSEESTGISSLRGFRDTHHEAGAVDVTTVAELVTQYGLERIDFLKVDVEGFDWHVLKGVPWDTIQPEAIICEFEDSKTIPLGYRYQDMADYLLEKGYFVYVSEWHPIVRYGMSHEWKQLMRYPSSVSNPNAWGNILGFKQDPGERTLASTFASSMGQDLGSAVLAPPTRTADGSKEATEAVGVLARAQPSRPDRLTTEIAGLSESNAAMRKWLDIKLEELRDRDRA